LKVNPLRVSWRDAPELGDRLDTQPDLSLRDAFWTQVGHKDRKRLTRAEED